MTGSSTISEKEVSSLLQKCAFDKTARAVDIIHILQELHQSCTPIILCSDLLSSLNGSFELTFSSAVFNLPFLGPISGGYMPNKEIITFDFQKENKMSLEVEILPFLPTININGDSLVLNQTSNESPYLDYVVRGKEDRPPSQWKILYADEEIVAAKSSVTGFNVIKRV